MKVRELSFTKGLKVTHNFNSVQSQFSMTVQVEPGDDLEQVSQSLIGQVNKIVRRELRREFKNLITDKLLSGSGGEDSEVSRP